MNYYVNTQAIEAVNEGLDTPTYLTDDAGERAFKLKYVSTDGWRGYYDVVPTKKHGWEKLDSDWVTGNWDDAPEDNREDSVEDKLDKLSEELGADGYKLAVVFAPTSNVFSTSYDIFKKKV